MPKHISFSQLKNWVKCPFYHKLVNLDKIEDSFSGNIYTAFGTAMHSTIEKFLLKEVTESEQYDLFQREFEDQIISLQEEYEDTVIDSFANQGTPLIDNYYSVLCDYFGPNFEIFSCEEQIYDEINDFLLDKYHFKGYIDLVVKVDDIYHILDWKTCSWGWDYKRKTDKMTTYQLVFYKYYYAIKHNIDPKKIKCHFGLLKRTAKGKNVEIFEVTSGPKRTKNALELLKKALHNIHKKNYIKNRTSCARCEFHKTKWCP